MKVMSEKEGVSLPERHILFVWIVYFLRKISFLPS